MLGMRLYCVDIAEEVNLPVTITHIEYLAFLHFTCLSLFSRIFLLRELTKNESRSKTFYFALVCKPFIRHYLNVFMKYMPVSFDEQL